LPKTVLDRGHVVAYCGVSTTTDAHTAKEEKMAFTLNHVHLKSQDPQQAAKFYVENLGATIVSEIGTRGYRLDLHGLTVNLTTHVEDQTRQQHYGMEHFALNTDDMDGTLAKLTANGARVLEQMVSGNGRRICFLEGPDGVQLEIIEMQR
jgi:predicted enzyme related to lactoylglutathione lyase